eukprot:5447460-Pleurochrysis_carterae.AAC.1
MISTPVSSHSRVEMIAFIVIEGVEVEKRERRVEAQGASARRGRLRDRGFTRATTAPLCDWHRAQS